ncbi:MAG TPA: hypothetical protein VF908_05860 [Gemmatimonadaceae bacterium]
MADDYLVSVESPGLPALAVCLTIKSGTISLAEPLAVAGAGRE